MAMLRHRERRNDRTPATLLYSSRTVNDIIYRHELDAMAARDGALRLVHTLTRERPIGRTGHQGRIDRALLAQTCSPPADSAASVTRTARPKAGIKGLVIEPWFGVFVPAGTPAAIVARLNYPLSYANFNGMQFRVL
jgi:hypothetical protein